MLVDPEDMAVLRYVAGFSEETYRRYASEHELLRKSMDAIRLWFKRNDANAVRSCRK